MASEWKPPFCANHVEDVKCPKCGEESVYVQEKSTYFDGDCAEAFCDACHAPLELQVSVAIEFSDPELIEP